MYGSNVPEFIQRQIQQLHEKEVQIIELEAELGQLRKDHAQLEHDLEPYRVGSSFADVTSVQRISMETMDIETAPINRCPDEILCLIFENCVLFSDHLYIRSLLLVCRRWYTLVINTAKLWAQIEISSPWDLFDIGSQKSQFSYIFACLNRSKNLPVTIQLDLQVLNYSDYIFRELSQHAKTLVDETNHDMILQQIQNQSWQFTSPKLNSQLERVIELLAGANGEHIKRWETMILYLPYHKYMAIRVWNLLARGLKAVKDVFIDNFPTASPNIVEPDFRTVKSFSLIYVGDVERTLTSFGLSPSTLEHLRIEVGNPTIELPELSHFQQLRTLELFCLDSEGSLGESIDFSISLPHLELLALEGDYGILAQLRLDFPSLYLLRLDVWGFDVPLPAIHPRHIQAPMTLKPSRIELKKVIRDYILLSNALKCITINHPLERDDVKEVVAQSRLEGKAFSLTQIIIEHKNGEVERIRV